MAAGVRLYAGTQHGLHVWRTSATGWAEVTRAFADRIVDVVTGDPRQPERVYASVVPDGLYCTDDGGQRWQRLLAGDVRAIAVDPSDSRVVYAGAAPVSLYRSENSGATWQELRGLQDVPPGCKKRWWTPYAPHTGHVRDIFVHPDDPNTIYLCLEHGGIVRSFDRGATWEDVSGGIDWVDMHMLAALPGSRTRYYTATAKGFYTSDDPAAGWARAEQGMTRDYFNSFLFLPPESPDAMPSLLVGAADDVPSAWRREQRSARSALFRSDDGAASWYRVGEGLPDDLPAMIWGLARHPHEPASVFAGTGAIDRGDPGAPTVTEAPGVCDAPGTVLLSRDRGASWEPLPLTLPADRVLWAAAD